MTRIFLIILFFTAAIAEKAEAQNLCPPLKIPAVLAGNFGELRSNHFHSGIDFKTQGKTGFNIYCAEDGYVSRVLVSPWGFGRAVYVTHPKCGLTTVYGHLSSFSNKIDKIVRAEQYKCESFTVDLTFNEGEIPVKRGEVIALSGNAGSSAGPHLHMDVRDTETGDALDPIPFYKSLFKDNVKPAVREIALIPAEGGSVNGKDSKAMLAAAETRKGFTAWGNVIPAINAYDKMTGTTNIYGVKYLTLDVDGKQVYSRTIDRFSFDATRAVNTLVDYATLQESGKWLMWTFVPDSKPLGAMITAENCGILNICEERDYKCTFTLKDEFGNIAKCSFTITGKRCEIPEKTRQGLLYDYRGNNCYNIDGICVDIPAHSLYSDMDFNVTHVASDTYLSDIVTIGNKNVPLASNIKIRIPIKNDNLTDKKKYCLVRLNGTNRSAVTAEYSPAGYLEAKVNRFGKYAITSDNTAPTITPIRKAKWGVRGEIALKISDNLSGIDFFRGEIDGKYELFELDGKSGKMTLKLNSKRVKKGKNHTLKVTVTDACGNSTVQNHTFKW